MVWNCWCASSIFTIQLGRELGCWVGHFFHGGSGGSMSFSNRTRRFVVDRGLVGVHFVNSYTISGDDNRSRELKYVPPADNKIKTKFIR